MSGRQLFTLDDYRGTGRPLLAVLADPKSVFMAGLRRFKRRTLYANIVNDRSAVYYTTCITKTDPYVDLSKIKVNYLKGYEDVILDPVAPVSPLLTKNGDGSMNDLAATSLNYLRKAPLMIAIVVFVPIGVIAFLFNSLVQTFRSSKRIQLHESGKAGIQIENYRSPIWIQDVRGTVEDVYENLNNWQGESYLRASDDEDEDGNLNKAETRILALERRKSHPQFPTLALTPAQFTMIDELDKVGWRKYPVWIHIGRHSHAAIIVRTDSPKFREGLTVLEHWIKEEFLI